MKLKVTQENLKSALAVVSRVAATRATLPILSNILLKTDGNRLVLAATNLEIAISKNIGGKVEQEGSITVPARLLNDFIANLPSTNIELSTDENTLRIKADKYESTINGVSADEFPSLPQVEGKKKYSISAKNLKTAIAQTVVAASNDEARQVLTGVYIHTIDKHLYLVATDSYRLAEKRLIQTNDDISVLVPASALSEVLRVMDDNTENVEISFDEGQAAFKVDEVELVSRLIEGNYPDYRQLIPKSGETEFVVPKKDLLNIAKISSLFAKESAGSITLNVSEEDQEIQIHSVASQVGENTSKASAKVTGSGDVTLNSRYLLDALNVTEAESVKFSFSGKLNPCVLTSTNKGSDDYLHIIMPLKS